MICPKKFTLAHNVFEVTELCRTRADLIKPTLNRPLVPLYPARRGYNFAVWAGVRKVASAENRSIFYRACAKFVTRSQAKLIFRSVVKGREFRGNKKMGQLWSATQDSRNALNRSRTGKKTPFFNLFVQISPDGFELLSVEATFRTTILGDSSNSENVASARRVDTCSFADH